MCHRPFGSVQEMNETLIANHNALVKPDDIVWFLGDVCMGQLADTLPLVARMNGRKYLILGNHDRPSMLYHHRTAEKRAHFEALYGQYFESMFEQFVWNKEWLNVSDGGLLHHLPYRNSFEDHEYKVRYEEYQPEDKGQWLIHGHVHDAWKMKDRQINVGVDVWDYKPVHFEQIREIING
jgi:calcineurin-like phosphoesterase family protein